MPHAFDRFYRGASARALPGSGLGLAIVRQVTEAHGGQVRAEGAAGGGTLMRMRLSPVALGMAGTAAGERVPAGATVGPG
jgi:two-component system sensor histidine kinase MprB